MVRRIVLSTIMLALIAGCASSKFACQQTIDGVKCQNIQAVYDEKVTATSIYNREVIGPTPKKEKQVLPTATTETEMIVRNLENDISRPIRVPTVILRIWTAPWEDSDGDLHKPGYIYTEIDQKRGRWLFGEGAVSGATTSHHPVFGSANMSNRSPQKELKKESKDTKKDKGLNPEKYYGQKPDANVPKLKFSK